MTRRMNQPLARPTVDIGAGAGAPPLERLCGIKFDLLREQELLAYSVQQITDRVQLTDAKLGLPAVGENCLTCRATEFYECPGHFGHIRLTEPIFHPSYVHVLKKFLDKICLACGQLKAKKGGPKSNGQVAPLVEVKAEIVEIVGLASLPCPTTIVKRPPAVREPGPSSGGHHDLALSGKGKRKFDTALTSVQENPASPNPRNYYFRPRKHRATKAEFVDLSSEDDEEEAGGSINADATVIHAEPVRPPSPVNVIPITVQPRKSQSNASRLPPEETDDGGSKLPTLQKKKSKGRRCKYCQPPHKKDRDPYPKMFLKVVPKLAGHTKDKIEVIQMEIDLKSDLEVPIDFWDFLGEEACEEEEDELEFATTRTLLASCALRILEKVSPDSRRKIGCSHPESMILRNLPVPPNCTRVVDENFGATASDYGDDKATSFLKLILQRNNGFKVKKICAMKQFELMQGLIGQYFRFKGAGKVTGALEPRLGQSRLSEQSLKTKWKNRLKDCVVGKLSNHCARSILTGDPLLGIGEIGIPDRIAGMVTVPVRVNNLNLRHFKEACDEVSSAGGRCSITDRGITYFERDEVLTDLKARGASWEPQIGDIAYRCLRDGDLVFANRNPSLHKHSLIALRVRKHHPTTVSLNPLLCSPFNADFDGDALHVFAPQSMEALGEMRELMTVPEQMICPQGGQVMVRLSQDALLGAYLLTSTGVFLDVKAMGQLAAEGRWAIPKPAIIKGPSSGPRWTGAQVFGLSLPADLDYCHGSGVLVRKGELLRCGQGSDWLGTSPKGIVRHICDVLGPEESVAHLDLAQSIIHRWLLMRGFSLGLDDVVATEDVIQRKELTRKVKEEFRVTKLRVLSHPLVSGKLLPATSDFEYIDLDADEELLVRIEDKIKKSRLKHLEEIGINEFRALTAAMEKLITSHMVIDNSLLRMVMSGSKGSFGKIVQQSGLVGLQLNVGAKLLPPKRSSKSRYRLPFPTPPEDEAWAGSGVIGTSYFEGLNPVEFFCHAVSSRLATISQCLEVKEPGSLFKSLMCFLRDVYVPYDGTVRNRFGHGLIQLYHGGALSKCESADMDEKEMREICKASAGDPAGVLAVTALVQPIYQAILDTPHQTGVRDMRPLELLQETLLPRFKSAAKASDRRVILRLRKWAECTCNVNLYGCTCIEKAAIQVQNHLRKVLLSDVTKGTAIYYQMRDESTISPWIGHIQLGRDLLLSHDLTVEDVILHLQRLVNEEKNSRIFGPVLFSFCCYCNVTRSKQDACIHFETEDSRNSNVLDSYEAIVHTLLPLLLRGVIKGSSLVRSVKLFWETTSSPTRISGDQDEEIVVEVETQGKQSRGKSFAAVKLACIEIMDLVDWNRSAPYSVQELRQTHGIEAAHYCILNRLKLAVKGMGTPVHLYHLQLIADFMAFSGDAIGFVYAGYKEYIRSISATAPFSQGAFQAPWKSFTDAAHRGQCEEVTSVLASCAWGKKAPIGTGADCDLMHQTRAVAQLLKDDAHELYVDKAKQVAKETAVPDLPFCAENVPSHSVEAPWGESVKPLSDGDVWGAGKLSAGVSGGWGDDPPAGTSGDGGWGSEETCAEGRPASSPGWGGSGPARTNSEKPSTDRQAASSPGWGGQGLAAKETEPWGDSKVASAGWDTVVPSGGWGTEKPSTDREHASSPGWGAQSHAAKETDNGAWGREIAPVKGATTSAGWGDKETEGERAKADLEGWGEKGKVVGASTWGAEEAAEGGWSIPKTSAQGEAGAPERGKRGQFPASPAGRVKVFDGAREKKWGTSCSGANLEPLGRRNPFWLKDDQSVQAEQKPSNGVGQQLAGNGSHEGGLDKNAPDGWGKVDGTSGWGAEHARGEVQNPKKNHTDDDGLGGAWGEDLGYGKNTGGGWGGDQPAKVDDGGWAGDQPAKVDDGGWGGDQPAKVGDGGWGGDQPAKVDDGGWGVDTGGGWGGNGNRGSEKEDNGRWGGDGNKGSEKEDNGRWGVNTGGWGGDQSAAKSNPSADWKSDPKEEIPQKTGQEAGSRNALPNSNLDGRVPARQTGPEDVTSPTLSEEDKMVKNEIFALLQRAKNLVFSPTTETGSKLNEDDEKFVVEQILRHHPEKDMKVSSGIDHVKVDFHPQFPTNRCLFLVRPDGSATDFSFHKCLQELARAKSRTVFENYSVLFKPRPNRPPRGGQE